jgi:hypothetical protein
MPSAAEPSAIYYCASFKLASKGSEREKNKLNREVASSEQWQRPGVLKNSKRHQ